MLDSLKEALKAKGNTLPRRRDIIADSIQFSKDHKDCIIVVMDAKKDDIIFAHGTYYSAMRLKSKILGRKIGIVRNILKAKDLEYSIGKVNYYFQDFLFKTSDRLNPKVVINNSNDDKERWLKKKNQSRSITMEGRGFTLKSFMVKTLKSWRNNLSLKRRKPEESSKKEVNQKLQ